MKFKKIGVVSHKPVGVPVTNQEKFDKLKKKNPALETLRDIFQLDIEL